MLHHAIHCEWSRGGKIESLMRDGVNSIFLSVFFLFLISTYSTQCIYAWIWGIVSFHYSRDRVECSYLSLVTRCGICKPPSSRTLMFCMGYHLSTLLYYFARTWGRLFWGFGSSFSFPPLPLLYNLYISFNERLIAPSIQKVINTESYHT